MRSCLFVLCLFAHVWNSPLFADLPAPRLDRVLPAGGAAGSSVDVEISGPDLDEPKSLLFDHPGITASLVNEKRFRVAIGPDVPTGTYDARFVGKFGLSNPRLFAVNRGFAEVVEKSPNDSIDKAMPVPMNAVVNGSTDGNREDFYRFPAKKGRRVTIDCQAQKIESPLDGTMTLYAADGKQLAASGDYHGRDPFIDFLPPDDGEYVVAVYDLSYRGGNYYRLLISDRASVENVFPRAIQNGKSAELTLFGRNLGADAKPSAWTLNDLPLEERKLAVTPPADVFATRRFAFNDHPTDYAVLATAATARVAGFQVQPVIDGHSGRSHTVLVSDIPVSLEAEPNDKPEQAQPLTLPAVVSGRFDRERDADWYLFECPETAGYVFTAFCEQIGGRADPYIAVSDDAGQRLGEHDDFGHRANAFDGHLRDPFGSFNLTAKKKYRVLVQDRYRRGGARYQYVLSVRKQEPDFHVATIHSTNPGPLGTNVPRGGAAWLDVIIHQESYTGPVTLTASKLPPGVHADPVVIHNNSRGAFVIHADENAPDFAGPIELTATGKFGDQTVTRVVKPFTRVLSENASRAVREQYIGVGDKAPFSLAFMPAKVTIEQGKKAEVKLTLRRLWPEFTGKVGVQSLYAPNNVQGTIGEIGDGKTEMVVTIEVNANAVPGEHSLIVTGQAQVPYQKDAKSPKGNQLVTLPSRPLSVVVTPTPKK